MLIKVSFPCLSSISLFSETENDSFIGSKSVALSYCIYSATQCGYLEMIYWCMSRLPVEISAHVSM